MRKRISKAIIIYVLFIFFGGYVSTSYGDKIDYISLGQLREKYNFKEQTDNIPNRFILISNQKSCILELGMKDVLVNGEVEELKNPVILSDSGPIVPLEIVYVLDKKGVLPTPGTQSGTQAYLLRLGWQHPVPQSTTQKVGYPECAVPTNRPFRVVIDPGHGGIHGKNTGKAGIREKDVVLDIALKLCQILWENGVEVYLTRTTDTQLSLNLREDLSKRTQISNRLAPALFLSIHANHCDNSSVKGFEIYVPKEKIDDNQGQTKNIQEVSVRLGTTVTDNETANILNAILQDNRRGEELYLANAIKQEFHRDLPVPDRGIREAGFYVIKWTHSPAVLVECGYLSNTNEENLLGTASYRQKLARSLANAILSFRKKYYR